MQVLTCGSADLTGEHASSAPSLIVSIVGPEQKPGFDELPVYG